MTDTEGAVRDTISAGAYRPDGVAVEVEGGFRVSGRWPLGSGSSHANWYVAGCIVAREGEPVIGPTGAPVMREVFFPAEVTEVIDTGGSTGLRGTASHDCALDDVFVPAEQTTWFQDRRCATGRPQEQNFELAGRQQLVPPGDAQHLGHRLSRRGLRGRLHATDTRSRIRACLRIQVERRSGLMLCG